jgi:hypothetical protein
VTVLATLLASTQSVRMDVTVFDSDLDTEGRLATEPATDLVTAFSEASK